MDIVSLILRGCSECRIRPSGAFKAPQTGFQLARAIAALDKGDVLLVTRLDRLARSTQYQIDEATKRLEAGESQAEIGRLFGVSHQTIGRL